MSEQAPFSKVESGESVADSYLRIQMLTSDVVFDQARQQLGLELASDENLLKYDQLTEAENTLGAKVRASSDVTEQQGYYSEMDEIRRQKEHLPEGIAAKYNQLRHRHTMLERYNTRVVSADSLEAQSLRDIIAGAPPVQPESAKPAPFSNFKENSEEAWQLVPDEAINDYLDEKIFRDPVRNRLPAADAARIKVEGSVQQPFEVPTHLLVGVQSFASWKGYDGGSGGKRVSGEYADHYDRQSKSYDVIKHYAALPTELPPVDTIELFIQPNGMIFGDNGSGDSHRLAAAMLRGQATIRAHNITITPIEKNIF